MRNILVSIDFHKNTDKLLKKAEELAKPSHAKIWLLHIAAPNPDFVGYEAGPQYIRDNIATMLKEEHQRLARFTEGLKAQGFEADGLLIQGPTVETIINESEKLKIDLLITGHYEHSFIYELFFGSTSEKLVDKSDIPVLVIPLGEED